MKYKKLSIVIPVYNEERFIEKTLKRVIAADCFGLEREIIIVDDGSTDKTSELLKKNINHTTFDNSITLKCIFMKQNRGKGAALRTGFENSTGDIIIIQDADLEYNPRDYALLLTPFLKSDIDAVYGSRTLGIKKFNNKYSGLLYYLGGKILTNYVNYLYGLNLTDQPTGYKSFKRSLLPTIIKSMSEEDFSCEIEITAALAKNNFKILEVPVSYRPRGISEGKKIKFSDFIKALVVGLKCRYN